MVNISLKNYNLIEENKFFKEGEEKWHKCLLKKV